VPAARFAMVGNSLRSDIEPVLALGGAGVHVPYRGDLGAGAEHGVDLSHPRLRNVRCTAEVPDALRELAMH
jgi:putative hydrolase of the HAD superfamily